MRPYSLPFALVSLLAFVGCDDNKPRFREQPDKAWTAFLQKGTTADGVVNSNAILADDDDILPIEAYFFFPEDICNPQAKWKQVLEPHKAPWNGNCRLIITLPNGKKAYGTGWMMGPRMVVTAGHCVHQGGPGGKPFKQVEVIPGTDGKGRPFGSKVCTTFEASDRWITSRDHNHDFGAILLPEPFDPGVTCRTPIVSALQKGMLVEVAGYPTLKPIRGQQRTDNDPLSGVSTETLQYMLDTYGGQSGSAVLHGETVVGIHNYGGCPNQATLITESVLKELQEWLVKSEK